jgi:D-3-phosphoglycerate dehydrogenase / 2-oxoglutarate reductase
MAILLLETVHEDAMNLLVESGIPLLQGVDNGVDFNTINAIITRGIGRITPQIIDQCANLKVVARCGVGLDNIDTDYCRQKSIPVIYAPGSNANTVAEHTLAFMLAGQRNLFAAIDEVKKGNWAHRAGFQSDELSGKTLGILGMGTIGEKVAKLASVFGMNVIYWSRTKKPVKYEFVTQDELFAKADVISLHIALNNDTKGIINESSFTKMKNNCLLINTARHQIIDEEVLIHALENKLIAGYAADVPMSPQPAKDHPLTSLPNAYITAHVSSLTATTYRHMCVQTVQNVLNYMTNKNIERRFIY